MNSSTAVAAASLDQLCVNTIRTLAMDTVQKAKSGHPGMPMGAAAMAYALWTRHLRFNPRNPKWPDRDRFILSAGHGCALQYVLLYLTGFDLSLDDLKHFRQWGSKTPGHPEYGHTPGIEVTTGPLGQGFGNAVGFAMAERILAARFNDAAGTIVGHHTYVIASDGDMMEGVASEAASLAGHLQLGRLIVLYDDNQVSLDGPTSLSFTNEDVRKRFDAYGWHTQYVEDGTNDVDAIDRAIAAAKADPRPSLIAVRTHIGYGAPHKQDTSAAHGEPLGDDEVRAAKRFYGWPEDKTFYVPEDALAHFRTAVDRGAALETEWRAALDAYRAKKPALGQQFVDEQAGKLPAGWERSLPSFAAGEGEMATRDASQKAINAIAAVVPALIGGSADLATSNKTSVKDCDDFEPGDYRGRNLRFGVREHAMAAALTGLSLHGGLRPYGGTFMIFSDYMRPSIRLAALQGANPIYVWTHDSIGLGEDGPTHQSIEQLPSLRAIPNMTIMRPADPNETSICWRIAVEHTGGPVGLALTRQKVPVLDPASVAGAARGGYVLAREDGDLRVILIGTGSEVHLCLSARELLQQRGVPTRVVSLPCWSIFEAQDRAYRDNVLPPGVHARVAVEAASVFGWERYVGDRGAVIGMTRFGASAPADVLFKEFGFTPERVVEKALSLI